jgi:hypothetical protein
MKNSKKNSNKMTSQGVRNLDHIGSRKPAGRRLEEPPPEAFMTPGTAERRDHEDADEFQDSRR